jgi:hypothetical protein
MYKVLNAPRIFSFHINAISDYLHALAAFTLQELTLLKQPEELRLC